MAKYRCLSVRQPFAWAIVANAKTTENRSWSTDYRGTIAIHASASKQAVNAYRKKTGNSLFNDETFPLGVIIGLADIVEVALYGKQHENDGSAFGPFCWTMANGRLFTKPIPLKGKLNLFNLSESVNQEIDESETFQINLDGTPELRSAVDAMIGPPDPFLSYAELYDEFFPRGLHQEALVAAANRMIELEPNSAEGYAIRASLKSDNSSPDEILTDLLRAIELDSNYQFPQTLLAVVYLDSENFQDAIVTAERAIQIDDANVVPYWVIARANRLLGRLEQSVDYGLLAIERNEKYVDAYCELGEAYAEQGKTAEAIEVLDKALELAPNDSEILLYKTKLENPEKS